MSGRPTMVRRVGWVFSDAMLMTWRNLVPYARTPYLLFFAIVQPIMFTLLFAFVFGGTIGNDTPNGNYVDFLLPGIIVQTVIFSSMYTGINIAEDVQRGVMDRFRALPMSRGTVLAARTMSDSVRNIVSVVLMALVGFAIGYRFYGGPLALAAAFGITILIGLAFCWIAALIGLVVKDTQTAELAGFTWVFPLVFASSVFVPVESMPGWLEAFASVTPITHAADAARAYSLNTPPGDAPLLTILWCVAIIAAFATLSVLRFRRMS